MYSEPTADQAPAAQAQQAATDADVNNLHSDVLVALNTSFDSAVNNIASESSKSGTDHVSGADIPGLRTQILANVGLLGPYIKANKSAPVVNNNELHGAQEYHVVTIGIEPAIRACLFSGGTIMPKKLVHSEESANAPEALASLLKKTQKMLSSTLFLTSKAEEIDTKAVVRVDTPVGAADEEALAVPQPTNKASNSMYWDHTKTNNTKFQKVYQEYMASVPDRDTTSTAEDDNRGLLLGPEAIIPPSVPAKAPSLPASAVTVQGEGGSWI